MTLSGNVKRFFAVRGIGKHVRLWCVLRPDHLACYASRTASTPRHVVLFDAHTRVLADVQSTATPEEFILETRCKTVHLRAANARDAEDWVAALRAAVKRSEWCRRHVQGSFAPPRRACRAAWLVDGAATFEAIASAMRAARFEVLIAGWWLCADLPLVPPRDRADEAGARLWQLVHRCARRGVKVYVLIYQEPTVLENASAYNKARLQRSNVHVIRHRDVDARIMALWSHHEKLVVVDRRTAFAGGLDMCLGRYDDPAHALFDDNAAAWPGKDYYNPRVRDFVATHRYE